MGAAVSVETAPTLVLGGADNVQPRLHTRCTVLHIPSDVLEQIAMVHLFSLPTTSNARFFAAVSLSQINQQTREILLSRAVFWADIVFDMYLNPRTAGIVLERSAGAPLRVEIPDALRSYEMTAHPNLRNVMRDFFSTAAYVERIQDLVVAYPPEFYLDGWQDPSGAQKTETACFIGSPKALRSLKIWMASIPPAFTNWTGPATHQIHYEQSYSEIALAQLESMISKAPHLQSLRIGHLSNSMTQNTGRPGYSPSQLHGALAELLVDGEFISPDLIDLIRRHYPRTFRDAQFIAIDSRKDKDCAAQSLHHLGIQDITERCSVTIATRVCTASYCLSGRKRVFMVCDNVVHGSAELEAKAIWQHLISCAESLHMRDMCTEDLAQHLEGVRAVPLLCATLRVLHLDVLKPVLCDRSLFSDERRVGGSTADSQMTPRIALPSLQTFTLRPTHRDYFHDGKVVLWPVFSEKQLSKDALLHVGKNWAWIIDQFELSQSERAKVQWASDVGKDDRRVLNDLVDQAWQNKHNGDAFFGPFAPGLCL